MSDETRPADSAATGGDTPTQATAAARTSALYTQVDRTAAAAAEQQVGAEWQVGDVLLDLYEVTGLLGEGGMGRVYKVHHRGWNVDLAVKSPRPEIFATAGGKDNFVREAETWVNLGLHPHTVSCYYVRTLGGIPRVFAEYAEGGSLADWIRTKKLYEGGPEKALERILDIAIQFAWGLHYAHEQELVHQDVKPANVMMTADGVAKVTDFGLAKARGLAGEAQAAAATVAPGEAAAGAAATAAGRSILVSFGGMTPAYCSPEQARGEPLSRKTDIWSWGLSVLEMFTGEVTWLAGQAAPEVLEGLPEGGASDKDIPQIPEPLIALLKQCFSHDLVQRPATMEQLAGAMCEIYSRIVARPYARPQPKAAELTADTLNNLALSHLDLGNVEEARRAWEAALAVDPQHLESTYNRGMLLWRQGEMADDDVVARLEAARNTHHDSWQSRYLLALVHAERYDLPAAQTLLEELVREAPEERNAEGLLACLRRGELAGSGPARLFRGHTGKVEAVCFRIDDRYAVSASEDKTLRVWEVASGQCVRVLQGHDERVECAAYSADGRWIASGSLDQTVRLWRVDDGRSIVAGRHDYTVESVCFSTDGRFILSGSRPHTVTSKDYSEYRAESLRLWDVLPVCTDFDAAIRETGEAQAAPFAQFLQIPAKPLGRLVRSCNANSGGVTCAVFGRNGNVAVSKGWQRKLELWDLTSGTLIRSFEIESVDGCCTLSRDGRLALTSGDKRLGLWDVETGRCVRTFVGHKDYTAGVSLSRDGRWAISCGGDRTVRLWDVGTGRCLRTFAGDQQGAVSAVCFSADARWALSGGWDATVVLWQLPTAPATPSPLQLSQVRSHTSVLETQAKSAQLVAQSLAALEGGRYQEAVRLLLEARSLPGCERNATLLDAWNRLALHCRRKTVQAAWLAQTFEGHNNWVTGVAFTPDGRFALTASDDRAGHLDGCWTVHVWDLAERRRVRTLAPKSFVPSLSCLDPSGKWALGIGGGGYWGNCIVTWDIETGALLRTFEPSPEAPTCYAISPDGCWVLSGGGEKHGLRLWDVSTGRCLHVFAGATERTDSVRFSENGLLAVSGHQDGVVRLWDLAAGQCLRMMQSTKWLVSRVAMSRDNRRIFGECQKAVWVWDAQSGACIRKIEHTNDVTAFALAADGRWLMTATKSFVFKEDIKLRAWAVESGQCLATVGAHDERICALALSPNGRWALSGSWDKTARLWELDWTLEPHAPVSWDESARPWLENFLALHTPYKQRVPVKGMVSRRVLEKCLTRFGRPEWTEDHFSQLLRELACAGYGWLPRDAIHRELMTMAASRAGSRLAPPRERQNAEGEGLLHSLKKLFR